jgi:aminoglycoside phosphotransferase (APT) family kinase protein
MKQNFEISEDMVKAILRKNNLHEFSKLREIETGLTNPVFVLNEEYVLRVNTSEAEQDIRKFKKEAFLYTMLEKYLVPVPKLFSFDATKQIINNDFLLLSYIQGETLVEAFDKSTDEVGKSLSLQLGQVAQLIHSVPIAELVEGEKLLRREKSWLATVKEDYLSYLTVVKDKEYLSSETVESISNTFKTFIQLSFPEHLVHGDFSPNNVQVKDGKIVGIFDFEFATIGDPLYDLQKLPIHFQLGERFDTTFFLRGYGNEKLSAEELIRLKMYCFMQGLWEIWATETQLFPFGEKEMREGKQLIERAIQL